MKILHLTLKKKWFDMIKSGDKTEEYREIKPYWTKRLTDKEGWFKHFDIVRFKNGYAKDSPVIDVEFNGTRVGCGYPPWGFEYNGLDTKEVYIIHLGEVL
jgi:hypothetical protein